MTQSSSSFTFLRAVFVLAQLAIVANAQREQNNNAAQQPGQLINVPEGEVITGGEVINVYRWVVPYDGPKEFAAKVGDTIIFRWIQGFHNVFIHPSMSCDLTGAIEVGQLPGTEYTFTAENAGTQMFFACDIGMGAHCAAGQSITVTVAGASNATVAPTEVGTSVVGTVAPTEVGTSVVGTVAPTEVGTSVSTLGTTTFKEPPIVFGASSVDLDSSAPSAAPISNSTNTTVIAAPDSVDAPVNATEASVAKTESSIAVTDAPVAVTDVPVAVTDAPVAVTDAPVAATDAPIDTTVAANMASPASGINSNVMMLSLGAACLALVFL